MYLLFFYICTHEQVESNITMINRIALFVVSFFMLTFVVACQEENTYPPQPNPQPQPERALRTVLVYMAADNSLSSGMDFAQIDLDEIFEGASSVDTEHNNLIVYIDRHKAEYPELIRLCRNTDHEMVMDTLKTYEYGRNSVGIEEMKEVYAQIFSDFPAESYGLVLWSHGEGWLPYDSANTRWFGQDKSNYMNISDLYEAMTVLPHLDFLLFDACFMQSIEVAYELRNCTDYILGSPTEIPGPGAPYDKVVPAFFSNTDDAETLVKNIASAYYTPYAEIYTDTKPTENDPWTGGVSIGILKCGELERLADATRHLLTTPGYVTSVSSIKTDDFLYYDRGGRRNYYFDFGNLMSAIAPESAEYMEWKQAFDAAMVYFQTTAKNYSMSEYQYSPSYGLFSMEGACGVSTYIPGKSKKLDAYYRSYQWSEDAGWAELTW